MPYPNIPGPKDFCSTLNQLGDDAHDFINHNPTHERVENFPKIDSWAKIEEVLGHLLHHARGERERESKGRGA